MWKGILTAAAVVGLVGCAATLDDRLQNSPDYTFQSDKSVPPLVNCIRTAWIVKYPADSVDIPGGVRLVHAGVTVEHVFDIVQRGQGSSVEAYLRSPRGYWAPKLIAGIEECL